MGVIGIAKLFLILDAKMSLTLQWWGFSKISNSSYPIHLYRPPFPPQLSVFCCHPGGDTRCCCVLVFAINAQSEVCP